jgi:glycosyltransferase involved in cell wall biosynthesis
MNLDDFKASVVVPIYNNRETIEATIQSITKQKNVILEVIFVDDFSSDDSIEVLKLCLESPAAVCSQFEFKLITHRDNCGLAAAYNSGIKACDHDIIVFMHPDITLESESEFWKLLKPFEKSDVVMSVHHSVPPPDDYWDKINIWSKGFLAPSLFTRAVGFNGQFDAVRKTALLSVGGFEVDKFLNAGEDGALVFQIQKLGVIFNSEAAAQHCHHFSNSPNFVNYLEKALQYGNAQGTLLRNRMFNNFLGVIIALHREVIVCCLLLSLFATKWLTILVLGLLLISSARIPGRIFIHRPREIVFPALLLPVEIIKHFVHFAGALMGALIGRQTMRKFSDFLKWNKGAKKSP